VTDDELTAHLLQTAGMRPGVPVDRERRVKAAFLREVRAASRGRAVRRRVGAAAVLVLMAAAAVATRLGRPREAVPPPSAVVATVDRVEGSVGGSLEGKSVWRDHSGARVALAPGDSLRTGDRIGSGASGRIGLRLASGVSLRFDRDSHARLESPDRLVLAAGAVYVDSGPASVPLAVVTSFGVVKDIGTQFEVRVEPVAVRVRVRSGAVEVHRGRDVAAARPGVELTVTAEAVTTRQVLSYGEEWAWADRLGPAVDSDGRTLAEFLAHVCREQGWTLVYADRGLALDAQGIVLRGSTKDLQPVDAVAVVVATAGLSCRLTDGTLEVARAGGP
jgi:ferric-dicitrate binding protein FerR (iron transport regulator)